MNNVLKLGLLVFLIGMLGSCKSDKGTKATVGEKAEVANAKGVTYTVNNSISKVMWEGTKPGGSHNGTIDISGGSVAVANGNVTGGSFTMDMNTINNLDLEGDDKAYLESHLKGTVAAKADDFFNVGKYPTAKFEITKITGLTNDTEGTHLVYGNLTMRDVTKQVGFKAKISVNADGTVKVTTPKFTIDRTLWGIKYKSNKFFDNLKDKVISDDFNLKINLVAKR